MTRWRRSTIGLALLALGATLAAARSDLAPVPRPEIDRLDARDRQQLVEHRAALDALLSLPSPETKALAEAFGAAGARYLLYDFIDAAEASLRHARVLAPEAFEWAYYLGELYRREGRLEAAAAQMTAARDLRPDDVPAHLRLGDIEADRGSLDAAEAAFRRALEIDPGSAAAHHGLARLALARGDARGAIAAAERALALQPQATVIHHLLGLAWRQLGDRDKARQHLAANSHQPVRFADPLIERLNASLQASRERVRLGIRALEAGQLEAAEAAFASAVAADPEDALAHYNLGRARIERGDRAAAIAAFERALVLDPAYRDAHVNLAFALVESGRLADAEAHFARAVELDPLDLEARRSWAVALSRLGRGAAARAALEPLTEMAAAGNEVRAGAYADLARLDEQDGDLAAAIGHLEYAVALTPSSADHRRALARALGRAGRYGVSAAQFQSVLTLAPTDVEARFGGAMAWLLAGREVTARKLLEAGLEVEHAAPADVLPIIHLLARVLAAASDAAVRDGERSLALAQQAFAAVPNLDHGETVAMAYAELGDFASALSWQQRAVEAARQVGAPRLARASQRLARYQRGEAERVPWKLQP